MSEQPTSSQRTKDSPDIVERLRSWSAWTVDLTDTRILLDDALAEIEELRKDLTYSEQAYDELLSEIGGVSPG